MSSVVRELITLWGFEIDQKPLKELDAGINTIKRTLQGIGIAVAAGTAAVGYLLNEAGKNEQTVIAFETMLGSAELAEKKLKELKEFALKTPFTLVGLQDASKRLLAYGFEADKLIPTISMLGDISAGVGTEKLPFLILALGQVRAAGRLTGMELRQFTENGVPMLEQLSKTLGKPVKVIQKMVTEGQVGFADVERAMAAMTGEGGRFFNLMERQSKSFLGIWSNIQDWIQMLAVDIGTDLLPAAKELFKEFLGWANANREIVKQNLIEFVRNLTDMVFGLVNVVKALYMAMNPVAQAMGGWNDLLSIMMKGFQGLMGLGLVYGIGLIAKSLFGLTVAWRAMGTAAMWAQIKVMAIPLAIGAIIVAIALIAEDILAFSQGRDSVFGRMVKGMDSIFSTIKDKFGFFGEIGAYLVTVLLTPIRMIINGFKAIGVMIDMLRGKKGLGEGLKNIGQLALSNIPGMGGNTDSFSNALGIASNIDTANAQMSQNNSPMVGLGGGLDAKAVAAAGSNKQVLIQNKLDVHGVDPSVQKQMIEETFMEGMNSMMRETMRDGAPQVER